MYRDRTIITFNCWQLNNQYKAINNILHPTTEDKAQYVDEDNISTHTVEETTTSEQQQEEPDEQEED